MAPWCHLLQNCASFTVDLTNGRRVRRHLDQVRKNTSTNIIDEPPTTVETNDDFPISVPNCATAKPPPNDVPPRESEHPELRRSDRTRRPPQRFVFDIN